MKKQIFLIMSFVLIFSFSLVSIAKAQAMGKSEEDSTVTLKNTKIKLGEDIIDMTKADRNREIVIGEFTKTQIKEKKKYIWGIKKKAFISPQNKYIAKIEWKINQNSQGYESKVILYDTNGMEYYKKEFKGKLIGKVDFLNNEKYLLINTEAIFEIPILYIYDNNGNLVYEDLEVNPSDIFVSPTKSMIIYKKRKDNKNIVVVKNFNKNYTKTFEFDKLNYTVISDSNYFCFLTNNNKIISFDNNCNILWQRIGNKLAINVFHISPDNKYFVYKERPYKVIFINNLNGETIWEKSKIEKGKDVYEISNVKKFFNNKIKFNLWNLNKSKLKKYIVSAIFDFQGNLIKLNKVKMGK